MATAHTLILATNNDGKRREFAALLVGLPVRLLTAGEAGVTSFPPEVGETFAANARAKAIYGTAQTGHPAIADDSGLVVDALGGAPGVYSARYGTPGMTDADRWRLLLDNLRGVPPERRTARFVAAIALSLPDGTVVESEGVLEGTITDDARGEHGFGYDPVFVAAGTDRTLAEMSEDEKNAISHRSRALAAIRPALIAALSRMEG